MPVRGPVRVVLALRPGQALQLGLKHRLHHRHPGGHAHRQQPLTADHRQVFHVREPVSRSGTRRAPARLRSSPRPGAWTPQVADLSKRVVPTARIERATPASGGPADPILE